jgi:hypothetical protein
MKHLYRICFLFTLLLQASIGNAQDDRRFHTRLASPGKAVLVDESRGRLAVLSADGSVAVLNAQTGATLRSFAAPAAAGAVVASIGADTVSAVIVNAAAASAVLSHYRVSDGAIAGSSTVELADPLGRTGAELKDVRIEQLQWHGRVAIHARWTTDADTVGAHATTVVDCHRLRVVATLRIRCRAIQEHLDIGVVAFRYDARSEAGIQAGMMILRSADAARIYDVAIDANKRARLVSLNTLLMGSATATTTTELYDFSTRRVVGEPQVAMFEEAGIAIGRRHAIAIGADRTTVLHHDMADNSEGVVVRVDTTTVRNIATGVGHLLLAVLLDDGGVQCIGLGAERRDNRPVVTARFLRDTVVQYGSLTLVAGAVPIESYVISTSGQPVGVFTGHRLTFDVREPGDITLEVSAIRPGGRLSVRTLTAHVRGFDATVVNGRNAYFDAPYIEYEPSTRVITAFDGKGAMAAFDSRDFSVQGRVTHPNAVLGARYDRWSGAFRSVEVASNGRLELVIDDGLDSARGTVAEWWLPGTETGKTKVTVTSGRVVWMPLGLRPHAVAVNYVVDGKPRHAVAMIVDTVMNVVMPSAMLAERPVRDIAVDGRRLVIAAAPRAGADSGAVVGVDIQTLVPTDSSDRAVTSLDVVRSGIVGSPIGTFETDPVRLYRDVFVANAHRVTSLGDGIVIGLIYGEQRDRFMLYHVEQQRPLGFFGPFPYSLVDAKAHNNTRTIVVSDREGRVLTLAMPFTVHVDEQTATGEDQEVVEEYAVDVLGRRVSAGDMLAGVVFRIERLANGSFRSRRIR